MTTTLRRRSAEAKKQGNASIALILGNKTSTIWGPVPRSEVSKRIR